MYASSSLSDLLYGPIWNLASEARLHQCIPSFHESAIVTFGDGSHHT